MYPNIANLVRGPSRPARESSGSCVSTALPFRRTSAPWPAGSTPPAAGSDAIDKGRSTDVWMTRVLIASERNAAGLALSIQELHKNVWFESRQSGREFDSPRKDSPHSYGPRTKPCNGQKPAAHYCFSRGLPTPACLPLVGPRPPPALAFHPVGAVQRAWFRPSATEESLISASQKPSDAPAAWASGTWRASAACPQAPLCLRPRKPSSSWRWRETSEVSFTHAAALCECAERSRRWSRGIPRLLALWLCERLRGRAAQPTQQHTCVLLFLPARLVAMAAAPLRASSRGKRQMSSSCPPSAAPERRCSILGALSMTGPAPCKTAPSGRATPHPVPSQWRTAFHGPSVSLGAPACARI